MQAKSTNSTRPIAWLAVPLLALAYPLGVIILPGVFRAIVPEVVRSVLSLL